MEKFLPMVKAAEYAGVCTKTLKRWLREAGYNLPGTRKTLIPEKMLQRVIEERMPRLARGWEPGVRFSRRRPRPKAPSPEGQQTAGDPTKV